MYLVLLKEINLLKWSEIKVIYNKFAYLFKHFGGLEIELFNIFSIFKSSLVIGMYSQEKVLNKKSSKFLTYAIIRVVTGFW